MKKNKKQIISVYNLFWIFGVLRFLGIEIWYMVLLDTDIFNHQR